eukprot:4188609-Prymnesium_polylepis.1
MRHRAARSHRAAQTESWSKQLIPPRRSCLLLTATGAPIDGCCAAAAGAPPCPSSSYRLRSQGRPRHRSGSGRAVPWAQR